MTTQAMPSGRSARDSGDGRRANRLRRTRRSRAGLAGLGLLVCGALLSEAQPALAQYVQQGPKLVGTGALGSITRQGGSIALSADGNTAIVGGYDDNSQVGAAWVFTRSNVRNVLPMSPVYSVTHVAGLDR